MDQDTPIAASTDAPPAQPAEASAPPGWTILCVDDEPNILSALRRLLRGQPGWKTLTAGGGADALALMAQEPVDLVISDMRMPGMDGAQFLELARQQFPDTERMLLTGQADLTSTVAAINRGEVYRYITKPWGDEELLLTVRQALERKQLQRERAALLALTQEQNAALSRLNVELEVKVAERTADLKQANEKVNKNYLASIKAFSNLIELRGASMLGHARRVADLARRIAELMELSEAQQREIFVAGLLHDIGHIGFSDALQARPLGKMSPDELLLYRRHCLMGEQSLLALDDMQAVSILIRHHHERYDGKGFPDKLAGDAIPIGAAILAVADAFDDLQSGHIGTVALSRDEARTVISYGRGAMYDPRIVDAFIDTTKKATPPPPVTVTTVELQPGMVLAKELISAEGVILVAAGHTLKSELISRIRAYEKRDGLALTILIRP